jgi:hypothetical protein
MSLALPVFTAISEMVALICSELDATVPMLTAYSSMAAATVFMLALISSVDDAASEAERVMTPEYSLRLPASCSRPSEARATCPELRATSPRMLRILSRSLLNHQHNSPISSEDFTVRRSVRSACLR